ncbi:MAG TPA: heavy metal-associated domain-containing protein [Pyrinomonadaceae bacterium]|nr:heavy metal-associated domain-containing protein [Pyrinomonadaceae bacterium]
MIKRLVIAGAVTALVLAVFADATSAATRTTTIYVTGMTCAGCAISIEQVLKNTEGVEEVRVSYERGEAVVKYDDRKVTAARLREAINGIGYRATARPPKKGRGVKQTAPACCGAESCDTQPPG